MSDISVTAANVAQYAGSGVVTEDVTAGASVTAGQPVYLDTADQDAAGNGMAKAADADLSALAATVRGIALHAASRGQPLKIQKAGDINPGGTVAVGTIYVASATAGGISPHGSLATGMYTSIIGIGKTASKIGLAINNSGVAVP